MANFFVYIIFKDIYMQHSIVSKSILTITEMVISNGDMINICLIVVVMGNYRKLQVFNIPCHGNHLIELCCC